jgi:hypothetical protein
MIDIKDLNRKNEQAAKSREQTVQSYLAKLLASENIYVEHRNVQTASFDTVKRVLTLPVYSQEFPANVVTMFIGHEIGHALWTDPKDWERTQKSNRGLKNFKDYINVAEDVRIERMVKVRYAGLAREFITGYQYLLNKDFFGNVQKLRDDSKQGRMLLVDRLNIFAKVGPLSGVGNFSDKEMLIVKAANAAESWDDVVAVAKRMYAHDADKLKQMQEEQATKQKSFNQDFDDDDDDDDDDFDDLGSDYEPDESDESEESEAGDGEPGEEGSELDHMDDEAEGRESVEAEESEDSNESDSGENKSEAGVSGEDKSEQESSDESSEEEGEKSDVDSKSGKSDDDDNEKGEESESKKGGESTKGGRSNNSDRSEEYLKNMDDESEDSAPQSSTQENFDRAMRSEAVDGNAAGITTYNVVNTNTPHDSMIDYKSVYKAVMHRLKTHTMQNGRAVPDAEAAFASRKQEHMTKLREKHQRYIQQLVREFELRRNAWQFARASEAKIGTLNMTKLHQYKYNDDLFKKITVVPQGKNHGFVMFIDASGSMCKIFRRVLEQAIVVAMFCRRVNIPFRIVTFTDNIGRNSLEEIGFSFERLNRKSSLSTASGIIMENLCCTELFNEKMTTKEFTDMVWLCLDIDYSWFIYGSSQSIMPLGGTPLNEMILSIPNYVKEFRMQTNAAKIACIVLTDGESANLQLGYKTDYGKSSDRIMIRSPYTNKVFETVPENQGYRSYESMGSLFTTRTCVEIAKDAMGPEVTMVGYHIVGTGKNADRMITHYAGDFCSKSPDELRMNFRQNKFFSIDRFGYGQYFVLWEKALTEEQEENEIIVEGKKTQARMNKAFNQVLAARAMNRTFLTKFMELVA